MLSEVQAILEGTFSGVNLLIIGKLSKAGTDIAVCVMPCRIEVVSGGGGMVCCVGEQFTLAEELFRIG